MIRDYSHGSNSGFLKRPHKLEQNLPLLLTLLSRRQNKWEVFSNLFYFNNLLWLNRESSVFDNSVSLHQCFCGLDVCVYDCRQQMYLFVQTRSRHSIYIRIVSSQLLLCIGTFVSFLAGLGQKLSVLYVLFSPKYLMAHRLDSFIWFNKVDNRRLELTVLIYILWIQEKNCLLGGMVNS